MGWLRFALAGCLVAGCSGSVTATFDAKPVDTITPDTGPDLNDGAHSGTRLKITYFAFADGTRSWDGFYDSQRKENCYESGPWPDGNYYCAPSSSASVEYSNATCTTPVGLVYQDPSCPQPPPTYLMSYDYSGCNYGPTHVYLRGNKLATTTYYYKNSDGSCGGPVTATNYDFYAPGSELAVANLAKLAIGAPMGSGTLTQRFVTSDDGLKFPWNMHDASLGTDCYPESYDAGGTTAVCAPSSASYASYEHDSACTIPELSQTHGCTAPTFAYNYPSNRCPTDPPKYYSVGSMVTAAPLYYQSGTSCTATTGSTGVDYYTTAAPLSLQSMTRAPDALSGHRMQIIHDTTTAGVRVRESALWDQQMGMECYPESLPDGTIRCYAFDAYIQSYFSDAACTQALDLASVGTGPMSCGAPPVPKTAYKYVPPPTGSCAYSYEFHTVGAAYTGPIYANYGTCQVYTTTQTQFYRVGPAIDPTTFATATIVTDQ